MSIKDIQRGRRPEWIKKFALAGVSVCFVFLLAELLVRYVIPAWPFETALICQIISLHVTYLYGGGFHHQTAEIPWG